MTPQKTLRNIISLIDGIPDLYNYGLEDVERILGCKRKAARSYDNTLRIIILKQAGEDVSLYVQPKTLRKLEYMRFCIKERLNLSLWERFSKILAKLFQLRRVQLKIH